MERKELYAKIKELGLQDEIKKVYGKNYTLIGNSDLEKIVGCPETNRENEEEEVVVVNTLDEDVKSAYDAACLAFLGILKDTGKLDELLSKL